MPTKTKTPKVQTQPIPARAAFLALAWSLRKDCPALAVPTALTDEEGTRYTSTHHASKDGYEVIVYMEPLHFKKKAMQEEIIRMENRLPDAKRIKAELASVEAAHRGKLASAQAEGRDPSTVPVDPRMQTLTDALAEFDRQCEAIEVERARLRDLIESCPKTEIRLKVDDLKKSLLYV